MYIYSMFNFRRGSSKARLAYLFGISNKLCILWILLSLIFAFISVVSAIFLRPLEKLGSHTSDTIFDIFFSKIHLLLSFLQSAWYMFRTYLFSSDVHTDYIIKANQNVWFKENPPFTSNKQPSDRFCVLLDINFVSFLNVLHVVYFFNIILNFCFPIITIGTLIPKVGDD